MINYIKNLQLIDLSLFPELFIGFSCVFLVIFHSFVCLNSNYNYLLTARPFYTLSSLIIFDALLLLMNDSLIWLFKYNSLNNFISINILTFFIKFLLLILTLYCFLSLDTYTIKQKNNHFGEYSIIILYSILGLLLILTLNDLLSIFLSIEIQSIAFYLLASFKKESLYSVGNDLKYLILGAASSSFFLFGSCYLYGLIELFKFYDFSVFWSVKQVLNQISSYFVIWETNSITLLSLCYLLATAEFSQSIYCSIYNELNENTEENVFKLPENFLNILNYKKIDNFTHCETSKQWYADIRTAYVWDSEKRLFCVIPYCLSYTDGTETWYIVLRANDTPPAFGHTTFPYDEQLCLHLNHFRARCRGNKVLFYNLSYFEYMTLDNCLENFGDYRKCCCYFVEKPFYCGPLRSVEFDFLNRDCPVYKMYEETEDFSDLSKANYYLLNKTNNYLRDDFVINDKFLNLFFASEFKRTSSVELIPVFYSMEEFAHFLKTEKLKIKGHSTAKCKALHNYFENKK